MREHPGNGPKPRAMRRHDNPWLLGCAAACIVVATVALGGFLMVGESAGALSSADLLDALKALRAHALAPLVTVPLFLAGSLVLVPLYAMIAVCAVVFDPLTASLGALGGTMIATALTHRLGAHFGRAFGHRVPGRISRRTREVAHRVCVWSVAGLQCLPIGPFAVVNMVVGAMGVPLWTFLAGTFIAMVPTTVLICAGVGRAQAALEGGAVFDPWAIAAIAAAGTAMLGLIMWRRLDAVSLKSRE